MDERSRFVTLSNLGTVYITLSGNDKMGRTKRRAEAIATWLEAIEIDEGESDRARIALESGKLLLARAPRVRRAKHTEKNTPKRAPREKKERGGARVFLCVFFPSL